MAMTNAERMKKYREKLKQNKVKREEVKAKSRHRYQSKKAKLTGASLAKFRNNNKIRQQKCRENKNKHWLNNPSSSSFKSRQSFGKSIKKFNSSLPKCGQKKKIIIQHLTEKFGKKDSIVIKESDGSKVTYQKRILFNSLRENDELFKEENANISLSRSSFAALRPSFVVLKAALAHRNCLRLYHENICLLLKSLDKYVDGKYCTSLDNFVNCLVCSNNNEECMFSSCGLCEEFFDENILENISHGGVQITWSQWANENGRAEKREFAGSVGEAALLLKSKLEQFLYHAYIKREQSNYFEKLKADVTDEKIVLQVDFSENFNMKEQDEVQNAHWNSKSLNLTHDKFVVDADLAIILNHIATTLPNQRFHFRNLTRIANKYNISLSWNFFATSHGKGVVDGIGGSAKRLVWSAVLVGEVCRATEYFVKIAKKQTKKIILIGITADAIDCSKVQLENIFKTVKSIPETLKMHSVVVVDKDELELLFYGFS
ncbi:unnamed protein product [Adineta ricciae]|uniref:Uncharacterized protein n=1 Tax=Adineta ricciae TaxID=249248 RepID=A0A815N8L4_ADIRI|nr:unnamed protein product [Adineta ricciae]CAF1435828.1 unnamed protein product [Adineta ricciae]